MSKLIGAISVPWFTSETWPELLKVAADRADLPDTFSEFELIAGRKFERFCADGFNLQKVLISPIELAQWCRVQRQPVNAMTRAAFATFVAMRRAAAH